MSSKPALLAAVLLLRLPSRRPRHAERSERKANLTFPSAAGSAAAWHKAGSDPPGGSSARSPGETPEPWGHQRALAAAGLSHGHGPMRAAAGRLPCDAPLPAAPALSSPASAARWAGGTRACSAQRLLLLPPAPCSHPACPGRSFGVRAAGTPWLSPDDAGCGLCPLPGGKGTCGCAGALLQTRVHAPPGSGSTAEGRGLGSTAEGEGLGPRWKAGGPGPQRRAGGQGPWQTPRALASHAVRGRWRHHPTGGWGSRKLLIITLLPGLPVYLSVSLTNQEVVPRKLAEEKECFTRLLLPSESLEKLWHLDACEGLPGGKRILLPKPL